MTLIIETLYTTFLCYFRELFSHDRIIIIHKILQSIGLSDLIAKEIIETSYPLHDGPYMKSNRTIKMNDRQVRFCEPCFSEFVPTL